MSEEKIIAVVVTFNRKALVPQTLDALKAQTRPVDRIVLIDNASTDGTPQALREQGFLDDPLIDYVRMDTNTGGAGGFHEGMKRAMEAGADWIWVMDDDACATPDALKQLVSSKARQVYGANAVLGSIVVNPENQEQLSFFVPDLKSYYWRVLDYYTNSTDDVSEIMKYNDPCGYPWGTFFNAVLFSRKVISTIGLPRREMFIWGDEVEYFHRTRHAGFKTYIIPFSIFIHPKSNNNVITEAKEKYKIRNRAFVHKTYKRVPAIHHAKDLLSIIASGKFYLLRPFIDGVKGNFTGNYLPR